MIYIDINTNLLPFPYLPFPLSMIPYVYTNKGVGPVVLQSPKIVLRVLINLQKYLKEES